MLFEYLIKKVNVAKSLIVTHNYYLISSMPERIIENKGASFNNTHNINAKIQAQQPNHGKSP